MVKSVLTAPCIQQVKASHRRGVPITNLSAAVQTIPLSIVHGRTCPLPNGATRHRGLGTEAHAERACRVSLRHSDESSLACSIAFCNVGLQVKPYSNEAMESDEALLAAWRSGDVRRGELLWQRHSRSVQRFFRNKVPWVVATDLAQRTLEHALRADQPIRSFRSYILGIAKHQLYDYLRGEQRTKQREADLDLLIIDETVTSPEQLVGAKREKRTLLRALRLLPLALQLVLELRYWERLSDGDIADVLGIPLGTVKTRIAHGRKELQSAIKRLDNSPERVLSTLDTLEEWAARVQGSVPSQLQG